MADALDSLGERTVDFTARPDLRDVLFGNLTYELSDRGLLVRPSGNDPNIVFVRPDLRFNQVVVTLQSEVGGSLELFWAPQGAAFSEERKRALPIEPSLKPQTYTFDLWDSLDLDAPGPPGQGGFQFRVDPIDRHAEVRVLSVIFRRLGLGAQTPAHAAYKIGKVTIERETRETVALPPGGQFDRTLALPAGAKLLFGLARSRTLGTPLTLVVSGSRSGRPPRILLEKTLDAASPVAWRDYQLKLPADLAGATVRLRFAVRSTGGGPGAPLSAGLLLCSNPVVVPPAPAAPAAGRPPNVLLISLDTVGARHLGLSGDAPGEAPFLYRLARQGARFEQAFSHSALTNVSHASMLTGLLPLPASFDGEVKGRTTLASILRAHGYQTAAWTGGVRVTESLGFDQGFDSFFQEDTLYREPIGARTDIGDLLARARAWLPAHRSAPFFLFLHTYEAHGPYWAAPPHPSSAAGGADTTVFSFTHMRGRDRIPPEALGRFISIAKLTDLEAHPLGPGTDALATLERARQAYHAEISRLDRALHGFFDGLKEQALLDDTVVVVTADHGEAFYEHGLLEHGLLYEENLHVPLLVVFPRRVRGGLVVRRQVGSVDIVPTILDLAGLHTDQVFDGRPRLGKGAKATAPEGRHYAWVPDNGFTWRLAGQALLVPAAYAQESFGKTELFDLRADPGESHNLLPAGGEGKAIPPRFARFVRQTVRQLPGIHLLFDGLGGRQLDWTVEIPADRAGNLYLFDALRLGPPVALAGPRLQRRLRLGERPELVVIDKQLPVSFSLRLADPAGPATQASSFTIETGEVGKAPMRKSLPALAKGATVTVWRVSPTAQPSATPGLRREEEDGLRSLGYVQH